MNGNNPITQVALALGSNLGDRLRAMRAAVAGLAPCMVVTATSHIYETAPAYVENQPAFLNAAVIGETKLSAITLLRAMKNLEGELGRQPTFHYGPRAIDIDLIFYGQEIVNSPELVLPHPRMGEREFVLRPLGDIMPNWISPVNGQTVAAMLKNVKEHSPRYDGSL